MPNKYYGKISITNIKNVGTLSVQPKVNMPASVIYDQDSGTYSPDWSKTNLIFEPIVSFNGEILSEGYNIEFKRQDGGGSEQELISGEVSDGKKLTVNKNVIGNSNSGVISYIAKVSYMHLPTNTTLLGTVSCTFSKTKNPSSVKYISISGENIFVYNSQQELQGSQFITLEAITTNVTVKEWQYKNSSGSFVSFPTTNNASINGLTLKVYATESSIFFDDKAVIRVLANEDDLYDIITIVKVRDGASGGNSIVCTLSNSSHIIPCDKDGEPYTYNGAETTVYVYEGGIDVSDEWEITAVAEPSSGIGGVYDRNTRTYKVNIMTVETGYIVFTCKKTDSSNLTARFSLVKNRAGNDGQDAIIYSIEPDTLVINRNKDNTWSHDGITFKSYMKIGNSKSKQSYSGRMRIYETTVTDAQTSDFSKVYESSNDEYSKTYTPSSGNIKAIKCELYDGGSFTTMLDEAMVVVTSDGNQGDPGQSGESSISIMLGNEAEIIPCTSANVAAHAQTITIPFYALYGIDRVECAAAINETLPKGMSKTIRNATTSTDGLITLSVENGATLGGEDVLNGEINIVFTCKGKNFTKKFTWTKSKAADDGQNAVLLQIQAPYGDVIVNKSNNVTLTSLLYDGSVAVSAENYIWKKFSGSSYVTISDSVGHDSIVITPDMVDVMGSFSCEATYSGSTYVAYYCVYDRTDPYDIFVDSSIGTQLINNFEPGAIYTRVLQKGTELDPIKTTIFSTTPPVSPSSGDYYYKLDKDNKSCVLMKYNGTSWVQVSSNDELPKYTYRYYKSDVNGNIIIGSDNSASAWKEGKAIYFDSDDTTPTLSLIVEVVEPTA